MVNGDENNACLIETLWGPKKKKKKIVYVRTTLHIAGIQQAPNMFV